MDKLPKPRCAVKRTEIKGIIAVKGAYEIWSLQFNKLLDFFEWSLKFQFYPFKILSSTIKCRQSAEV